jgi:cyclopropane-fatty-acyl-phospholipid synthase
MNKAESTVRGLLELAEIGVSGERPWDVLVTNPDFYQCVLGNGSIGLGEAYMDGWWDCEQLDVMICKVLRADLEHRISPLKLLWPVIWSKIVNLQSSARAYRIGEHHYDMGNDLYQLMLDPRMTYTCGYW